jgi:hypothetical protein
VKIINFNDERNDVTTPTRARAVQIQMIHVKERNALITSKQRISDFSPALLFVEFGSVWSVHLGFTSEELEEHDLIMRTIFKVRHIISVLWLYKL